MGKTVNLASRCAKEVQERFYRDSITQGSFSRDLDVEFTGVKTVRVYEVDTAKLNDYTRSGASRYGTPEELTDNLQEFVMTQDKSFTYTIDKGNAGEQCNIKQAGASLKRQLREVVTPCIDRYRMKVWAEHAGIVAPLSTAPGKTSIGSAIMDGTVAMDDALVPPEGRTLYVTSATYKLLKLCNEFTASESLTNQAIGKGTVGQFDGMTVKKVPASYMPEGVYFMIVRKDSAISPVKLNDYKIHADPPGISGDLVEGRVIYDAFVKGPKAKGIYVAAAKNMVVEAPEIQIAGGTATLSSATAGALIRYTLDGSDPSYSATARTYDAASAPAVEPGQTLRACARKEGLYPSAVTEQSCA